MKLNDVSDMDIEDITTRLRGYSFWGLLLFAFSPTFEGNLGKVQGMVRAPINLTILTFTVLVFFLFTPIWWVGLIGLGLMFYFVPKGVKKLKRAMEGTE